MSTPGRLFFQAIIFIAPYCYLSSEFSKLIVLFPCSSEASFSTSDSYVFLSFSIEWCSERYVFALFMRRVRSDGVLSSSLERLTNSYKTKTQIILTNHNYDNLSVQCSAQIRTDREYPWFWQVVPNWYTLGWSLTYSCSGGSSQTFR